MLGLKLRKWLGHIFDYWCPECGSRTEEYGYDFLRRCPNTDCTINRSIDDQVRDILLETGGVKPIMLTTSNEVKAKVAEWQLEIKKRKKV